VTRQTRLYCARVSFFDYAADAGPGDSLNPPFLDSAGDQEWALLRSFSEIRRYPAGALLARAGSADRSLYLILRGEVDLREPGRSARRHHGHARATDVIGEIAFFDAVPRAVDFVAVDECEVLVLSYENFRRLAALEPALAQLLLLELGRALAHRVRVATTLILGAAR
jgi:CRP-like cAMP-binding protein